VKTSSSFFVSSDTRGHGVANDELHRPKASVGWFENTFLGVDWVRTTRLATLKRELESLRMNEGETVDDFATKLTSLASKARSLGYELEEVDLAYEERIKGAEKMEDTQGGLLFASDGKSHGCKHCGGGSSNRDDFGRGRGRGRGFVRGRDANEQDQDKSHVKCYKCGDYGHYQNKCPKNEEANLISEEPTLL
nr:hypothetical protein [Tanacetum cinerariifolium]